MKLDNLFLAPSSRRVDLDQERGEGSGTAKKGKKKKGGSGNRRGRGRPKKKKTSEEPVFEDDIIEHFRRSVNNEGEVGQSNVVEDKGLSDLEEYNSDELVSGSDSDENDAGNPQFPVFKMPNSMKKYEWEVGTLFMTKVDFQLAVRTFAVENARDLKFKKNDLKRMRVTCKGDGCEWEMYCGKIEGEETWQLRKIIGEHTCALGWKIKMMNSKWLGSKLHTRVRENRDLSVTTIMQRARQKWGMDVNEYKAYRAKNYAVEFVEGSFREQYRRLHDYGKELIRVNPESSVTITGTPYVGSEADLESPNHIVCPHFQRMYVCFKGCRDSFFKCISIIGLDGCFLKTPYGGMLLTAIGMDPNDQYFQLLMLSWKERIKNHEHGLFPAIDALLPGVEQRFCVRHLYNNFRKRRTGKKLKDLM
ncbi:uncharacterized protein [Medicago truncatula]|uniref:uncharacterized protein n=1 Tax=Medicago truncatula TaxID=3880 RepID=UPI000D2F2FFF|nr:uncharacterized protein LOC112419413 [Medicago truncatula]